MYKFARIAHTIDSNEKEVKQMKPLAMGLGMIAGAALAVTAITTMYPDVPRRMLRDGKRAVRTGKRMMQAMPF